ncbi:hypothetical protein MTO96_005073 [Rhipicephalus appendiculatus]
MLNDLLRTSLQDPGRAQNASREWRDFLAIISNGTEFLWQKTLPGLRASIPKKPRRATCGVRTTGQDELFYIAENRKAPRAETCSVLFGSICGPLTSEVHNWTIHISVPSKSRAHEDSQHNSMEDNSEEDNVEKGVKVLHISDTHYDPEYSPGSNAVCDDPVCCRKNNGLPKSAADRAGRWGHLGKCDIPLRTLESALKHASENHKV